ncbi:putative mitochondrial protein [Cucumis melo var. makuwa]|uniref:Mitochondrial protein n=1 Tax=Cucumis melo var. makuwa TaxID=1194695 RepID=A0A5A7U049_CUCMM|nr:putative mitochondrial protein [Cucumis melo var. makuwa]
MHLSDDTELWWRLKANDVQNGLCTIKTWKDLKKELRAQFFPKNVESIIRRKLRELKHIGTIREYMKQFSGVMLDIWDMSEKDKIEKDRSKMQAVNSKVLPIVGISKRVSLKLGEWRGDVDLVVVHIDNFDIVLVECQTVFDDLKVTMTRGPVHGLVDVSKPFIVEIDTSDFTLGSILTQEGHPIAYESHKPNNTERRYTVSEKEILVVGHCLRALRQYLLGSPFVVKSDKLPSVTSSANLS